MECSHCGKEAIDGFDLCNDCMEKEVRSSRQRYGTRMSKEVPPKKKRRDTKTDRCKECNNRYVIEMLKPVDGRLLCPHCRKELI